MQVAANYQRQYKAAPYFPTQPYPNLKPPTAKVVVIAYADALRAYQSIAKIDVLNSKLQTSASTYLNIEVRENEYPVALIRTFGVSTILFALGLLFLVPSILFDIEVGRLVSAFCIAIGATGVALTLIGGQDSGGHQSNI